MKFSNLIKDKDTKKALVITALFFLLLIAAWLTQRYGFYWYTQARYKFSWEKKIPPEVPKTDSIAVVVIAEQRSYIFHKEKFVKRYTVTTGSKIRYESDRSFRPGLWKLTQRIVYNEPHPLYGTRLIYLQYFNPVLKEFVPTQKAFHGTSEEENLGYPTSMGCVYYNNRDIVEIYNSLTDNTLVIATEN